MSRQRLWVAGLCVAGCCSVQAAAHNELCMLHDLLTGKTLHGQPWCCHLLSKCSLLCLPLVAGLLACLPDCVLASTGPSAACAAQGPCLAVPCRECVILWVCVCMSDQ